MPDSALQFSLTLIALSMASIEAPPLRAVLSSKIVIRDSYDVVVWTDSSLDIEIEGINKDGKQETRSWYFARLYVANKEVAKSTKKPASSVLNWEWNSGNQMCVLIWILTSLPIFISSLQFV